MKNLTLKFLFVFLFIPILSSAQIKVNYKVFYHNKLEDEGLKITLSYNLKKASDSTYFHYSNDVWGQKNIMNCLKIIEKDNPNLKFKIVSDSNRIVVYHPKTKKISFTYRILQDAKETSSASNRPRVKNNFFHILGQSLFVVPEDAYHLKIQPANIEANIEWTDFPNDFKIHNTFGTNQKKQIIKAKLDEEFYHSLFVGGDYRIYDFKYQEKPVYLAIRGKWFNDYQDEKILETLKKTIPTQRNFWKDNAFDYYTVIMTPSNSEIDTLFKGQSMTGSGVKNGFLIQSSNNKFNNYDVIRYVFNHEMMHDWIGGKIKMKNEELNYWFSEGFTDYYTFKNRLQSGDLTLKDWLRDFNKEVLQLHWKNPKKNEPNYVIKDDFWKSRNVEKIPYRRGAIFAFWLDNQILKKSNYKKSLDDVMREILKICVEQNKLFSDDFFLEIVQKYLEKDIKELTYFFQKHIINGVDFDLKNEDLIPEFQIEYVEKIPKINMEEKSLNKYILK